MPTTMADRIMAFRAWWESRWPLRAVAAFFNPHRYISVQLRREYEHCPDGREAHEFGRCRHVKVGS
jgi:hypothetical protein